MIMSFSVLDDAADALRRFEQGGKHLLPWERLPNKRKELWQEKARVVFRAAHISFEIIVDKHCPG